MSLCPLTRSTALGLKPQPHLQNWGGGLHDPDTGKVEEQGLRVLRKTDTKTLAAYIRSLVASRNRRSDDKFGEDTMVACVLSTW